MRFPKFLVTSLSIAAAAATTAAAQLRKGPNELLIKTSNFMNITKRLWAISCVVGE